MKSPRFTTRSTSPYNTAPVYRVYDMQEKKCVGREFNDMMKVLREADLFTAWNDKNLEEIMRTQ